MAQHHARFAQRLRHLEPREHAQDAVEAPATHHGVAVRAGGERRQAGFAAFAAAGQVAGGVEVHGEAGLLELAAQPIAGPLEFGREGAACPGNVGAGEGGKGFEPMPEAVGLDGDDGRHARMVAGPALSLKRGRVIQAIKHFFGGSWRLPGHCGGNSLPLKRHRLPL
jgi:hypothetical protein